ncbi:MAG: hydrogenase maturation nickel metallochaperone HypA [Candidatus Bathyarchaeota archaeon]|nr:hydrogenase maturation nickel metallochaperone HypA [Candidatus Bathyarchaeota archaeon]
MHEFSVTSQIVQSVLEEARKHRAKKVKEVSLIIGELTFLGLEQVRFAYEILTKDTIMEDSNLLIKEGEGVVKCNSCGYEGDFKYEDNPQYHLPMPTLRCPKCDGIVEIVGGKECIIESIRLVVE